MKTSNLIKTSLTALTATSLFILAAGTASASVTTTSKDANVKAAAPAKTAKVASKTNRAAKLPREWVWKKYTKKFDSMYRR